MIGNHTSVQERIRQLKAELEELGCACPGEEEMAYFFRSSEDLDLYEDFMVEFTRRVRGDSKLIIWGNYDPPEAKFINYTKRDLAEAQKRLFRLLDELADEKIEERFHTHVAEA